MKVKEPKSMVEVHKIREDFYKTVKNKPLDEQIREILRVASNFKLHPRRSK